MDQVPTLEFKPFTINAPTKKSKATKKGRALPFSKKFEEDESERKLYFIAITKIGYSKYSKASKARISYE